MRARTQSLLQSRGCVVFADADAGEEDPGQQDAVPQAATFLAATWDDIEKWNVVARENGYLRDDGNVKAELAICLVNIAQRVRYMRQQDVLTAPTLLCSSELYDLKKARLLEVFPEYFLINGYPAPGPLP